MTRAANDGAAGICTGVNDRTSGGAGMGSEMSENDRAAISSKLP